MSVETLLQRIKDGEVEVTDSNYEKVSEAFCETYFWQQAFKLACLEDLPDPEGLYTKGPSVFEQWIVNAYSVRSDIPMKEIRRRMMILKSNLRKRVKKGEWP